MYNLVSITERWSSATGKVTVGLADAELRPIVDHLVMINRLTDVIADDENSDSHDTLGSKITRHANAMTSRPLTQSTAAICVTWVAHISGALSSLGTNRYT